MANWQEMPLPHRWFSCRAGRPKASPYCEKCWEKLRAKWADPAADDLDSYIDWSADPWP